MIAISNMPPLIAGAFLFGYHAMVIFYFYGLPGLLRHLMGFLPFAMVMHRFT